MLRYYFYKNFKLNYYHKGSETLFLLASNNEVLKASNELMYLNRVFSKFRISDFKLNKDILFSFNYSLFFMKFKLLAKIIFSIFKKLGKKQVWNIHIFSSLFFLNLNFYKVPFSFFDVFFIPKLEEVTQYSLKKFAGILKPNKTPERFLLYYFMNSMRNLFVAYFFNFQFFKNIIVETVDFFLLAKVIKTRQFLNHFFKYIFYV